MRKINKVGPSGLVLSTLYVFESEKERDDVFGRLKQTERESYYLSQRDINIQYRNALVALQQQEEDSLIEPDVDLCECGHHKNNHSLSDGKCIRYPGEDPCPCTEFKYMWTYDGNEGKRK